MLILLLYIYELDCRHVNSNGNDLADKAAKEAAIEASTLLKRLTESYTDVCGYIKQTIRPKW